VQWAKREDLEDEEVEGSLKNVLFFFAVHRVSYRDSI